MSVDGFDTRKIIALKPTDKSNAPSNFCLLTYIEAMSGGCEKKESLRDFKRFVSVFTQIFRLLCAFLCQFILFWKEPYVMKSSD